MTPEEIYKKYLEENQDEIDKMHQAVQDALIFGSGVFKIPRVWISSINDYYGPAVKFEGRRRYLIDGKYLTSKEYKEYIFNKDMKELLK